MDGKEVDGRRLFLDFATPRDSPGGSGGGRGRGGRGGRGGKEWPIFKDSFTHHNDQLKD